MDKKKKVIFLVGVCSLVFLVGLFFFIRDYRIRHAKIIVNLIDSLDTEFLSEVKVSDFISYINGEIVDDYVIDTTEVGNKNISFSYINEEKIKVKYTYEISVVDRTAPVVWLSGSYTVKVGSEDTLTKKILCGDNYDDSPVCEIIGDYNLKEANIYPLLFRATDSSGNVTEKKFNLKVIAPSSSNGSSNNSGGSTPKVTTDFQDVIQNYKTDNTEIGLDISHHQGDVDFQKLKQAGVEFVFIRVGRTKGIGGEYVLDTKFLQNIEEAEKYGIPVGIYFYSYANSKEAAIADANWVLEQIKDKKVDLPIAFDWENWNTYNNFGLSFFGLSTMANEFLNVFKEQGYDGVVYSSKNYLESIWMELDYPVWLAHYVKNTNYEGEFLYWQLCSNGRVDGINGDVDIDIRYKK